LSSPPSLSRCGLERRTTPLSDDDEAILVTAKLVLADHNRGGAYDAKADYNHAVAALDQAIRLNPEIAPSARAGS
jgi:hypothetical protein